MLEWSNLRPWNGSLRDAFEELCCQLAHAEEPPGGGEYFRKGRPDAGVECFWKLADGQEWAWQAKFFRESPTASQWTQITSSFRRAFERHPFMTKYVVCLPLDLPDSRDPAQETALAKWKTF